MSSKNKRSGRRPQGEAIQPAPKTATATRSVENLGLPALEELEALKAVQPDFPDRVLRYCETQLGYDHAIALRQLDLEDRVLAVQSKQVLRGQLGLLFIGSLAALGGLVLIYTDKSPQLGRTAFGVGIFFAAFELVNRVVDLLRRPRGKPPTAPHPSR